MKGGSKQRVPSRTKGDRKNTNKANGNRTNGWGMGQQMVADDKGCATHTTAIFTSSNNNTGNLEHFWRTLFSTNVHNNTQSYSHHS